MPDVNITYKGESIASMDASGTKTLNTQGKYCEGDIIVQYVDPEKPTQTKSVTPTESAQTVTPDSGKVLSSVSVGAIPSNYVGTGVTRKAAQTYTPTTTDQTIAAGQYLTGAQTVKGDANLVAANIKDGVTIFGVQGSHRTGSLNCKVYSLTLDEDVSGAQVVVNPGGDADIAEHRASTSFVAGMIALFDVSGISTRAIIMGNNELRTNSSNTPYGVYLRSSNSGVAGNYISIPVGQEPSQTPGTMSVDSDGVIRIFASSGYPMLAGSYVVICGWGETT